MLSYILWRDIIVLLTRDSLALGYGARWRNVKLTALVYAMSHEWWVTHILGQRALNFRYTALPRSFMKGTHPFTNLVPLLEYEQNLWINRLFKGLRLKNMYLGSANFFSLNEYYKEFTPLGTCDRFCPRRVGFIPKRLAI